jgi:Ca2+-binding RTX toxin-like protein
VIVKARRGARLLPVLLVTLWAAASTSGALASNVTGGRLVVDGGGGPHRITVTCVGGDVRVNGSDPSTGPEACANITGIVVHGGRGRDTIDLSAVDASAFPSLANVFLNGGPDRDRLFAPGVGATLQGGSDADTLRAGAGTDDLRGGEGRDLLREVANTDFTITDTAIIGSGQDSYAGIEKVSVDAAGAETVTLDASAATRSVSLSGGGGNDTLIGGSGADRLRGSAFFGQSQGNDRIEGGPGNDVLSVDGGNDSLHGGPGSDLVTAESVAPTMTLTDSTLTGAGTDALRSIERASLSYSRDHTPVVFDASQFSGRASLFGWNADDTLIGGAGPNVIDGETHDDRLRGGGGHDVILGGYGNDSISGGTGGDDVYGGRENEDLSGDSGRDLLVGGIGMDRLNGGSGPDVLHTNDGYPDDVAHGAAGNDRCLIDPGDMTRSCERGNALA